MMTHTIETWEKKNDYLICIDSDGTAIDSMTVKHLKCFGPNIVKIWGLEAQEKDILDLWNHINLYSETRGINRFLGLNELFKRIVGNGITYEEQEEFENWIKKSKELSNSRLIEWIQATGSKTLQKVLDWSNLVNLASSQLTWEAHQPFNGAVTLLKSVHNHVDIAVISSANQSTLLEEWAHYDLLQYVDVMTSQEIGTKEACLRKMLEKGYWPDKVIMIGDALADQDAALKNGALFYPIMAGKEEDSWRTFNEQDLALFLDGTYKIKRQERLLASFSKHLSGK